MSSGENITPNPNFFSDDNAPGDWLQVSIRDGIDLITLVIQSKEGEFPKILPHKLKRAFAEFLDNHSSIESLRQTRQGKIFLATKSVDLAQKILSLTHFLDIPVSAFIQIESITSKFLLRGIDPEVDCKEIAFELKEQGLLVHNVRRFLKKTNDSLFPTTSVLVTILGTSLPYDVKLWYRAYRIQPFHDRPRRCLNCNKFNHATRSCTFPTTCVKCSISHEGVCTTEIKCSNCHGPHEASDVTCPTYALEVRIQEFKSTNHLSIGEARRQFSLSSNSHIKSYASAASAEVRHSPLINTEEVIKAISTEITNQITIAVEFLSQQIQALFNQFQANGNLIAQNAPSPQVQPLSTSVLESGPINNPSQPSGSRTDPSDTSIGSRAITLKKPRLDSGNLTTPTKFLTSTTITKNSGKLSSNSNDRMDCSPSPAVSQQPLFVLPNSVQQNIDNFRETLAARIRPGLLKP